MIEEYINGKTLITLGQNTVVSGNLYIQDGDKPVGFYYTNIDKNPNTIIFAIPNNKAVAFQMITMVKFLEEWCDESTDPTIIKALESLQRDLKPILPTKKT